MKLMTLNELRIGNHILINGETDTVTGIFHEMAPSGDDIYFVQGKNKLDYRVQNTEPIELTEETLLKCHFFQSGFYWWSGCYSIYLTTRNSDDGFFYHNGTSLFEYNHIKYLHQLQNLYFIITGKELEVNL